MHVSSADTSQIATLRALDEERHRAAISYKYIFFHGTPLLNITAVLSANRLNRLNSKPTGRIHRTMASGAHTGDSLPTNSHSPATPKAATGFRSYAEYLAKLERSPVKPSNTVSSDELWLASIDGDGHCMEWNHCYPHSENITKASEKLPALDESGVGQHTRALSPHGFRTVLKNPD